jgi:predicted ribosomally synthesized peptide with nif11-like leader
MSQEKLSAFLEAVKTEAALQKRLQSVTDPDAIVAIAQQAGFEICADDLVARGVDYPEELSDEALEAVTGGVALAEEQRAAGPVGGLQGSTRWWRNGWDSCYG